MKLGQLLKERDLLSRELIGGGHLTPYPYTPGSPVENDERGGDWGGGGVAGANRENNAFKLFKYPQPLPSAPPLPRAHLARAARQPLPTVQPRIEATAGSCGPGRVARRRRREAVSLPKVPKNRLF